MMTFLAGLLLLSHTVVDRISAIRGPVRIPLPDSRAFPDHFITKVEFSRLNLRVSQPCISFEMWKPANQTGHQL
jgi:hypothetical protein